MNLVPAAVSLGALGWLALAGCARPGETLVRDQAAAAFSCADYALHVEEVGPDVYRASGCGQELIYACSPAARPRHGEAGPGAEREETTEVADTGTEPALSCVRRPQ